MVAGDRNSIEAIRQQLLDGATSLADQARLLCRSRAVVMWLSSLILLAIALLLGDMLLRAEELGLRLLALATLIAAAVGLALAWLRPAWRFAPTRIDVAQWVERCRPEEAGSLSTVVQLCEVADDDPRYGSLGFRRQAIAGWAESKSVPAWSQFLDTSKWWQALLAMTSALFLAVVVAIGWPAEMRLAASRLLFPWSDNPWPKIDRLEFLSPPTVVAIGTPVQLEVIDLSPPLPAEIEVIVREIDAANDAEPIRISMSNVGDVAVGNLPRLEQAVEVRAVGGDDDRMPWHRIDVVQAPAIEDFVFVVQPPEYSGKAEQTLSQRRVRVLAGSRAQLSGKFSEALQSIEVVGFRAGEPPAINDNAATATSRAAPTWNVSLSADQQRFLLLGEEGQPLLVDRTLQWQFRVTTLAGLQIILPDPWSIDVETDLPPEIVLLPSAMTQVVATGQVPIKGEASDDIELASVAVLVQYPDEPQTERGELFAERIELFPVDTQATDAVRQLAFERLIELSSRRVLPAGSRLEIVVEAVDSLGQAMRTPVQAFDIRSADDMLLAMQAEQQQLLSQVRQLLDIQRANERLVDRIAEQLQSTSDMRRKDIEGLATATRVQQSIANQLADDPGGLLKSIRETLAQYAQNQLNDSIAARELLNLQGRVEQLGREEISQATTATAEALQAAQLAMDDDGQTTQAGTQAVKASAAQSRATGALQDLLDDLATGESAQQLQKELSDVLRQQEVLQATTDALQLESLAAGDARGFEDRRAEVRADQQALARQVDELQQRAAALQDALSAGDDDTNERRAAIDRASRAIAQQAVGQRMRDAAQQIADDQFVAANSSQQAATDGLQQALRQLGGGSAAGAAGELTQQAQQLRQAGEELSQLADRQSSLAAELASPTARDRAQWLAEQQAALREETLDKTAQMQASLGRDAQRSLQQSTDAQQQAEQAARTQAMNEAADASRTAAEKLADSARDLQQRANQVDRVARQQQLFQLSSELNEMVAGQEEIVQSLLGMDAAAVDSSLASQVSMRQEALRLELRDVRREISQLPTFDWAMEQVDLDMMRSSAATQRLRIDPEARDAAAYALNRLQMAATALANSRDQQDDQPSEAMGGEQGDQANQQEKRRLVPPLASLKLLRALQQDVHNQTVAANEDLQISDRTQRLTELAAQQQSLGEQLSRLLQELSQSSGDEQQ